MILGGLYGRFVEKNKTMPEHCGNSDFKRWRNKNAYKSRNRGFKKNNATENTDNALIQSTIIMFVKANFGNTDIKEKEQAQKTYSLLCNNLSLSTDYKESGSNAWCEL